MKKVMSLIVAVAMILTVSVAVFADDYVDSIADTVLFEHTVLFPTANNWWLEDSEFTSTETDGVAFAAAVVTDGAKIVIKTDLDVVSETIDNSGFQFGIQKTFDGWESCLIHYNFAGGEGSVGADYVEVTDEYVYVVADAADFVAACAAIGCDLSTDSWKWINGASNDAKTYAVYVITTASAEETDAEPEDTTEGAPAEETPAEEAPAASSPNTGVALCLVPMAIAALGAVASKRR